jgi:hypothetical protein
VEKSFKLPLKFAAALTEIAAADRGGRGVSRLCRPEMWQEAAELLYGVKRVAVVSGFYVPEAQAPETDGPCGAAVLARAFREHGSEAQIWTDELCLQALRGCAASVGFPVELVVASSAENFAIEFAPEAVIFTERLGRAADGRYYNMRGKDVSSWASPLDAIAIRALAGGLPVVGIGDGGNEVGMGNFFEQLSGLLPQYSSCLSVVRATAALPVDVSNWGAYALSAALSLIWNEWRGPREGEEKSMLNALCGCGAVDGVSLRSEPSVDGFPLAVQNEIVSKLKTLFNEFAK